MIDRGRDQIGKVEEMHSSQTIFQAQKQGRRKVGGMGGARAWMVVSETGESSVEEVEKHSIMRRTGLPARDLRLLDPMLSHSHSSSSILGRERAIVVSLEHIKAIITANEVLMITSSNPLFTRFLQDLQARIPSSDNRTPPRMSNDTDNCYEVNPQLGGTGSPSLCSRSSDYDRKNSSVRMVEDSDAFPGTSDIETKWGDSNKSAEDRPVAPPPKHFPFEFRALEACLDSACRCLESETQTLEEEAYPALDELTSQISTLNLERVRQIKSRLVALSGRVKKVRDQLEDLLDDDNDMAEMYLTHKLDARLNMDQASSSREGFNPTFEEDEDERDESYSKKSDSLSDPKLDVEELEMLLEAYFARISGISQKLSSLSEYVDDTEDCINISLDDKRNQLLQVAVIIDTLTMILNTGIVVVALFGMNIHIELYDGQPHYQFWATAAGTFGGCMALFLVSVWWGKKRYLFSA